MQNSGYVGVVVGVVFLFCVFLFHFDCVVAGKRKRIKARKKTFAPPRLFIQLPAKGEHRAAM